METINADITFAGNSEAYGSARFTEDGQMEFKYGDVIYREGDKVLQLLNIPDSN